MNDKKNNKIISRDELREMVVSIVDLGFLLDVSASRINQLIPELEFIRDGKGIKMADAVQKFAIFLRSRMKAPNQGNEEDEKKRQILLQNEMLELKIAEKNADLVPIDLVGEEWERIVVAAKQKLLAIPTKAAPNLINETTELSIKNYLDGLVREALGELTALGTQVESNVRRKSKKAQTADVGAIQAPTAS